MSRMTQRSDQVLRLLGVLGLLLFLWFSWQDPSWRQSQTLSRDQAIAQAQQEAARQGIDVTGWRTSALLESDAQADGYLGRYGLHDEFQRTAPQSAPLNWWSVSFADKSGSRTELLRIDAETGKNLGFQQTGGAPRPPVERVKAVQIAQAAMKQYGLDPAAFPAPDQIVHPNNTDTWMISWQVPRWQVGEMKLRYEATVSGDRLAGWQARYQLPESFLTWHDRQQSIGTMLTLLSLLFSILLFLLALVFLFVIKRKRSYRSAIVLTLTVFVLFLVTNLNQWPLLEHGIAERGGGLSQLLLDGAFALCGVILLALIVAASTFPAFLTGGLLVQEVNPQLWMSRRDPAWPQRIRQAVGRGYWLALAWLGFQGLFYWAGEKWFGVWGENDYSLSPLNMSLWFLFPLLGWLAGLQEEGFYRLFAVTFFKRYLRSSFIAVLLPAMIWALGHSLYPVYPIYTRFIELTLFGILIGYCYFAFGFEAVLFAHVIFDVIQMCLPLLGSGQTSQVLGGIFYLVLPVLVAIVTSRMRTKSRSELPKPDSV